MFRLDPSEWNAVPWISAFGNPVLENPLCDVWEIRLPDGTPEQFFTYRAAIRELGAADLRFPSAAELEAVAAAFPNDPADRMLFRRSLSGFLHVPHCAFYDQRANAYRWAGDGASGAKDRKTFPAVRNGANGRSSARLPGWCAAPVAVAG